MKTGKVLYQSREPVLYLNVIISSPGTTIQMYAILGLISNTILSVKNVLGMNESGRKPESQLTSRAGPPAEATNTCSTSGMLASISDTCFAASDVQMTCTLGPASIV